MKRRFSPIKLICTVAGAVALLAAAPFAGAARPNATMDRDTVHATSVGSGDTTIATALWAQNVVIEREPKITIIRPEPEVRVRIESPGHYEDRKILVKPGHFEEYQVWIPERFDPELNATFHGHYETRQRWIPDAYEYRKVWVPAR
jgi:hypothetical protein